MVDSDGRVQEVTERLDTLVGSIVTMGSRVEWAFIQAAALCDSPHDAEAQRERAQLLYGERGPVIARRCAESVAASPLPYPRLRDRVGDLCAWYADELYPRRNRVVHDAWVIQNPDSPALARFVTERRSEGTLPVEGETELKTLRHDIWMCHHYAFGFLGTLRALAAGDGEPHRLTL